MARETLEAAFDKPAKNLTNEIMEKWKYSSFSLRNISEYGIKGTVPRDFRFHVFFHEPVFPGP
jgi:hypothetical protein